MTFETPDTFRITSTKDSQSAILIVTYGLVQTSMSIHFSNDDLFYTTTITMKNIGDASLKDLTCKRRELYIFYSSANPVRQLTLRLVCISDVRTMDPDNDFRSQRLVQGELLVDRDKTNNYVKYQRGNPRYEHPTQPNTAMVCACGMKDFNSLVCMAAVHPGAVALQGGHTMNRAQALTTPKMEERWQLYGGNDVLNEPAYQSRMRYADESIHLLFRLGSLAPGDSTTFTTSHILNGDQMPKSVSTLGGINILQPTDLMTGTSVPFVVGELHMTIFTMRMFESY